MNTSLLQGELVRLVAANSETDAELFARWSRDSEYMRLQDSEAAQPVSVKRAKEDVQRWLEDARPNNYGFVIRTLADDRPIGAIGLDGIRWSNGDTFVGIGIGEREYWGNGYGTDAMRVILHFAFAELNLHRVSLDVFEYNPRAIRSYEKVRFVIEGRVRQALNREGRRWDVIYMSILREEWEQLADRRSNLMTDNHLFFRPATHDDFEPVFQLYRQVCLWLNDALGITNQWDRNITPEDIEELFETNEMYLVLLQGEVAGAFKLNERDHHWDDDGAALYVHAFAVNRKFKGLGIGRAMLDWAGDEARRRGKLYVRLDCMNNNPRLKKVYADAGFEFRGQHSNGWSALFERKLT